MRRSLAEEKGKNGTGNWMKVAGLAVAILATAGAAFHLGQATNAADGSQRESAEQVSAGQRSATRLSAKALSAPLFFEPNQGQTASPVKFLAHGAGYGLFLTADEAVLELRHPVVSSPRAVGSVIRMRLDGAEASPHVSGVSPLPGKSSYFIGKDPAKWHRDIPQFGRVEYQSVYPGIDLVYYGNQGQLEYDFRVAPGADPKQITMSFAGATAHIVAGNTNSNSKEAGDLILSTANGDVRFHAPRVYQPVAVGSGNASGVGETTVAGSFRQLADNKIGFEIGAYDHSRELVIDPTLTYSTYLGGSGTEGIGGTEPFDPLANSLVRMAIDGNGGIYLAGSTNSADFPLSPAGNSSKTGVQNVFVSVIDTSQTGAAQLAYSIYLGGSQSDYLEGIAVDSASNIYVAGYTTSGSDFPVTSSNAFNPGPVTGTHGFMSNLTKPGGGSYSLTYSTYLAGNGTDMVSGVAADNNGNAYVTGTTTSTNAASNGFPANPNGLQIQSNAPSQFFASKIDTQLSGSASMIYSTYFGGGNPQSGQTVGGGIAVDTAGNMYITGGTNFLPVTGATGEAKFPLNNAEQSCLDEANQTKCTLTNPTALDAFVAKITPTLGFTLPVYATYVGGSGDDIGYGIAVDGGGNAYITGSTDSPDFIPPAFEGTAFQQCLNNTVYNANNTPPCPPTTAQDAFLAKINNPASGGTIYQLNYASYIGGSGNDVGEGVQVDTAQGAHVVGSTLSPDLQVLNALPASGGQNNGTGGDAFVAQIVTTLPARAVGDYLTYLGGSQLDQGTGVAVDLYGATFVAGTTQSTDFPVTANAFQPNLDGTAGGPADAFVTKIGALSGLTLNALAPSPSPVQAGSQVAFTFSITNNGPDPASQVTFAATVPTTGVTNVSATVTSGAGNCTTELEATILCYVPTLAVNAVASVQVNLTPTIPVLTPTVSVSGIASANNGSVVAGPKQQTVTVTDFGITVTPSTVSLTAGQTTTFQVSYCPLNTALGYSATVTPSQTTTPSMVTATTPTFNPTTVVLSGTACGTTTLSVATVARPVNTGSLLRRGSFYAAWLPIGGLSLVGLGIGVGGKRRRRWLTGAALGLVAGMILLQLACGSSSSSVASSGGTLAGNYIVTVVGSAGTQASHSAAVTMIVN